DYLPQINLRLNLYKRMSSLDSLADIDKIRAEVNDRFGPMPENVENLLRYGAVKFLAQRLKIETMDRLGNRLIVKFFPSTAVDLTRLSVLLKKYSGSLTPQGVLSIHLRGGSGRAFLDETVMILKELYGYTIMN
ncbi:MAG TPA: transcription-repair coupling factor, partial [Candidatus Aminicenantes bacterium]|nr:transcription-repair coupling factor [Candidatus Aminicenantes bacterium]